MPHCCTYCPSAVICQKCSINQEIGKDDVTKQNICTMSKKQKSYWVCNTCKNSDPPPQSEKSLPSQEVPQPPASESAEAANAENLLAQIRELKKTYMKVRSQNADLALKVEMNSKRILKKEKQIRRLSRELVRVQSFCMKFRKTNIHKELEITGVPEKNDEDLYKIIMRLARKLGMKLTECDIENVQRVEPYHVRHSPNARGKPNPIVVHLTHHMIRNKLLMLGKRSEPRITTEGVISGPPLPIQFNERLRKPYRDLLQDTYNRVLAYDFMYFWISNGMMWVQKTARHGAYCIETQNDITRFVGPPLASTSEETKE